MPDEIYKKNILQYSPLNYYGIRFGGNAIVTIVNYNTVVYDVTEETICIYVALLWVLYVHSGTFKICFEPKSACSFFNLNSYCGYF